MAESQTPAVPLAMDPGRPRPRLLPAVAASVAAAVIIGCGAAPLAVPTATPVRSPAISGVATPSPVASPTVPPPAELTGCAAARDVAALHVVHHFSVAPDDIGADAHGHLWVSALEAGQLFELDAGGGVVAVRTVAGGPEGVAIVGADVYVAQQTNNSVRMIMPVDRQLVALPNHTGNAGIDGIAIDPGGNRLLVPDSPNGRLLAVGLAAPHIQVQLAQHLGRPVAAAVDAAGTTYVASESSPGLVAISPSGAARQLGRFTNLDEVVAYGGLLYITELDHRDVLAVDPTTGASAAIAVNVPSPQGLAVTAAGTLEIVDAVTNTVYSMPACGVTGS